ncbi:MAG: hypothetical protein ABIQ39_13230 [Ilumatobacteraceae bacterium]
MARKYVDVRMWSPTSVAHTCFQRPAPAFRRCNQVEALNNKEATMFSQLITAGEAVRQHHTSMVDRAARHSLVFGRNSGRGRRRGQRIAEVVALPTRQDCSSPSDSRVA